VGGEKIIKIYPLPDSVSNINITTMLQLCYVSDIYIEYAIEYGKIEMTKYSETNEK